MPRKLFLTLMLAGYAAFAACSKPAQEEAHDPEEVERAVSEAEEEGNEARTATKGAQKE